MSVNDLIISEYCPYDVVTLYNLTEELKKIVKEKNYVKAFREACKKAGLMTSLPEEYETFCKEDVQYLTNTLLIQKLEMTLLYMNYCLKWLDQAAKKDKWALYDHDLFEILQERDELFQLYEEIDKESFKRFKLYMN